MKKVRGLLYPVHDAPADYQRFTRFELELQLSANGMIVEKSVSIGHSAVTAAAMINIALTKSGTNALGKKHLFFLFDAVRPVSIPVVKFSGWLLGKLSPVDDFMQHNIFIVARKQDALLD